MDSIPDGLKYLVILARRLSPAKIRPAWSAYFGEVIMHAWQMQEAKARLSEVVKRAESEGPQDITLHGRSVAVVLSRAAF